MSEDEITRKVLRISMLGDTGVGKTSIINRFLDLGFSLQIASNIGVEKHYKEMKMKDGKKMKVILWDTAGQERFHAIATNTIKTCQGIVLSFDLTKKITFEKIPDWIKEIKDINNQIPIILFGNKCDMIDNREVEEEDGQALAKEYNLKYFETSAKENININEGLAVIIHESYAKSGSALGVDLEKKKKKNGKKKRFLLKLQFILKI